MTTLAWPAVALVLGLVLLGIVWWCAREWLSRLDGWRREVSDLRTDVVEATKLRETVRELSNRMELVLRPMAGTKR